MKQGDIIEKQLRDEIADHETFLAKSEEPQDFASTLTRGQIEWRVFVLKKQLQELMASKPIWIHDPYARPVNATPEGCSHHIPKGDCGYFTLKPVN